MRELIERAIRERLVLAVDYHPGRRLVEPHAFGYSSENHLLLRAYQTDGASASGEHQWWKLFRFDRFASIALAGIQFIGPRPEYKQGDKAMRHGIICQL